MTDKRPAYCQMADAIEAGTLESTKTVAEWRGLCPGSLVGSSGGVLPACDACPRSGQDPRDPEARCATCWDWDEQVEKVEVLGEYRCADVLRCAARVIREYAFNPLFKDEVDGADLGTVAAVAAEPEGRCDHCGIKTRGAKFAPGHDLMLRALLLDLHKKGDVEASKELAMRSWLPADTLGEQKIHEALRKHPEKACAWFDRRMNGRMAKLAVRLPLEDIIWEPTPASDPGPVPDKVWALGLDAPAPKKRPRSKR